MNSLIELAPNIDQFHGYTFTWMSITTAAKGDTNHNRLATAMRQWPEAAGMELTHLIEIAAFRQRTYFDAHDSRYQRRRAALEAKGWTFTFDGWRWKGNATGLEVASDTIAQALEAVGGWGESMREQWRARRAPDREAATVRKGEGQCAIAAD
ncbi:MAG TPA: hypothetical protein P5121_05185 [Caldilineaceae bacterium]|nr:hypothetical protein [Caldilineaceae bacterium]